MFMRYLLVTILGLGFIAGCTTTTNTNDTATNKASERLTIDASVNEALNNLYAQAKGSREMIAKSEGVLVFPSVVSVGLVVGGEYGKGALLVKGKNAGYYKTTAASVGLQAGAQSKAVYIVFMTKDAMADFKKNDGWTAGVDANVALFTVGADGSVDTSTSDAPVVGFVLTNGGLMFNLSLNGTKVSPLDM